MIYIITEQPIAENNTNSLHSLPPINPNSATANTGQTGLQNRSDRSGLGETLNPKSKLSGRTLGVSGLPSLENSDPNPECLDHHKLGVSE